MFNQFNDLQNFTFMKTSKLTFRLMMLVLWSLPLLLISNCSEPTEGTSGVNPFAKPNDWVAMLNELFYDPGIIVEKQESIQDAINEAQPGEAIYIEPGTYQEPITIDKPDIKLIGLSGDNGEKVIIKNTITRNVNADILNIQFKNSTGSNSRQSSVGGRKNGTLKITRNELPGKTAHYTFEVKVGKGQYDVVRIHRVVREHKPYQPIRTRGSLFMLHGASLDFEAVFLKAGADIVSAQTSSAFYLASKAIDVWGMDFGWTLVPGETTDFSFMQDWGVERDADHAMAAMSVARLIRGISGQGFGRLNLLGYSYGVIVGYAAAGHETQQHPCLRDIKGLIAVDQVLKYDVTVEEAETSRKAVCTAANQARTQLNNGVYHGTSGQLFASLGNLAINNPDGTSGLIPTLTNYQAALFIGTNTYNLPSPPPAPFWHFAGGSPTGGLLYTEETRWFNLMASLPPYQPTRTTYEARACGCDEEDVSIDDHIAQIKVPIFYIGAGGAFGTLGYFTSSLTASSDPTNENVTFGVEKKIDFGHGDLFLGNEAPTLVWEKLHSWLITHHSNSF
jgi:hypothetical protein